MPVPMGGRGWQIPTDPQEAAGFGQSAKSMWQRRDQRMRDDQLAFEQALGTNATAGNLTVTLNDCKVLVKKSAAMIAGKPPVISVLARRMQEDHVAQQIENFLTWLREEFEIRYMDGVRNPLCYDEAQMILLRGWICGRLLLDPDDYEFPWRYDLIDPIQVYPGTLGRKPRYIAHVYKAQVSELIADWGDAAEQALGGKVDPKGFVEVTGIYTDNEMGLMVAGGWIKPPVAHGYGFNPLHIVHGAGSFYRATEYDQQNWSAQVGAGILDAYRELAMEKQDAASMMKTLMGNASKPPVIIYTDDEGHLQTLDLKAAGVSVFGQKDRVELLQPGPQIQSFMPYMEMLQSGLFAGGLGPAAYSDKPFTSGFHEAIAQGTARDMLFPFVRGLERYYAGLYHHCIQIFKFAVQPVQYAAPTGTGRMTMDQELDPVTAEAADVRVKCEFEDIAPQDRMAMVNQASMLSREHLLSLETIRRDWLGQRDTELEGTRVIADLILQNPQLIQMATISAALQSSDPNIQQMAQAAQMQMMMQQQGPQGPPGSQDPNAQPPLPGTGVPNSISPDELQQNAGAGPNGVNLGPAGSGPEPALQQL